MARRRAPRRTQNPQNIGPGARQLPTRGESGDCPSPPQIDAEHRPQNRRPTTATKTTSGRTARTATRATAANSRQRSDRSPSAGRSDRESAASKQPRRGQKEAQAAVADHGENLPFPCGGGLAKRRAPRERKTATSERRLATRSTGRSRATVGCRQSERRATDKAGCRMETAWPEEIADTPAPSETTTPAG